MQSESCIWDIERVCNFVLSQEEQTTETEKRDMGREREESFLFHSILLYYKIPLWWTALCLHPGWGQRRSRWSRRARNDCSSPAEGNTRAQRVKTTSLEWEQLDSRLQTAFICDHLVAWNAWKRLTEQMYSWQLCLSKEGVKPFMVRGLKSCTCCPLFSLNCIFLQTNSVEVFIHTDDSFHWMFPWKH